MRWSTPATLAQAELAPAQPLPTINIKTQCGAAGDGKTNDTHAFQKAATLIEKAGGGTLEIPKGEYIVGEQTHVEGQYPYYQVQPIFAVRGLNGFIVKGNGSTLRLASGLRFGSFDKDSGEVYEPTTMPFVDKNYAADAGVMLAIRNSRNVVVRDLELDGNASNLVLGGPFGDTGRQLYAYGLSLYNNSDVQVQNIHTHHHGLDGLVVGWSGLKESDPPTPHTIVNVVSEYNARQGFSWVGGRGMKVYRSKFNHTGRALNQGAPLMSSPGAGLDIEAEESVTRDGYFEDCEFINNAGCAMVADSGDGGHTKFKNCTFWGTTSWSVWTRKPGIEYEDCKIYGSAAYAFPSPDPQLATRWTRCTFEGKSWKNGKVYRAESNAYLLELNGSMENVTLKDCTLIANTCRSVWVHATPEGPITFDSTTIFGTRSKQRLRVLP